MTIWIDADACPVPVREMVIRASERTNTALVFVANSPLPVPRRALIKTLSYLNRFQQFLLREEYLG